MTLLNLLLYLFIVTVNTIILHIFPEKKKKKEARYMYMF